MSDKIDYTSIEYTIHNPRAFRQLKEVDEDQQAYMTRCEELGYTQQECWEGFNRDA